MPDKTCKLTLPALALLAAVANTPVLAQDTRWFRVELLVFANESTEQPAGAAIAEQWEPTPRLAYPLASRFLVDTARVAQNAAEFEGESLVDEYGRQIITFIDAPVDTPPAAVPVPPTPVYQEGTLPDSVPAAREPAITKPRVLPRPFVLLPENYREMRGKAALMERGGRYTVLFHETWVQPVGPEKRSLPIVLDRSGDTQEWSRLQGTINLFLSRYLHVQTNLWLNTAGEYLPGTWQMPAPPLGPPSLVIEEQEPVDIATAIGEMPQSSGPNAEESVEVESPIYPYRHAVLLEQTRRMRSNEIHYIDHPLMGVIIKFTPISGEDD